MASLKLIVFNVEEGQCIYVRTPEDYGILIDCGRSSSELTASPVVWLAENEAPSLKRYEGHPVAAVIITSPDDGHSADLEMVIARLSPAIVHCGGDRDWPDLGADLRTFSLSQQEAEQLGGDAQQILNNQSTVAVVTYNSPEGYTWKVVAAGDNETKGWEELLEKPGFKDAIKDADFFITSNHGQESGFCAALFEVMGKPLANIISIRSKDEKFDKRYRKQGQGVKFPDGSRTYFITREDGNITVAMHDDGRYDVWLYTPASS